MMFTRPPGYHTNERTPYGIREPAVKPEVLPGKPNWMRSLLHFFKVTVPNDSMRTAQDRVNRTEATTNQIRGMSDYEAKLFGATSSGITSGEEFPITGSSLYPMPWPVGTNTGRPTGRQGRDYATRPPQATRPIYAPQTQQYGALLSSNDARSRDLIPIGGGRREFGLDYGVPPWRVPYIRKSGLGLMAGISQHGQQQTYSGIAGVGGGPHGGSILMAPPVWSDRTRGTRGASGIVSRVQGPGRSRIPGVFVPREVK